MKFKNRDIKFYVNVKQKKIAVVSAMYLLDVNINCKRSEQFFLFKRVRNFICVLKQC